MAIKIRTLTTAEDFEQIKDAWNGMLQTRPGQSPFASWEWQYYAWRHLNRGADPLVAVIEDSSAPRIICPLVDQRSLKLLSRWNPLTSIAASLPTYGGLMIGPGAEEAAGHLMDFLRNAAYRKIQGVRLWHVVSDSPANKLLHSAICATGTGLLGSVAHAFDSPVCSDTAKHQDAPTTRGIRRNLRALQRDHDISFDANSESVPFASQFDALGEMHEKRWRRHPAQFTGTFASQARREFTLSAASALAEKGVAYISWLKADEQPIAGVLGFEQDDTYYYYRPSFDPDFGQYGPGNLLIYYLMRHLAKRGTTRFDFMRGTDEYKLIWADSQTTVLNYSLTSGSLLSAIPNVGRTLLRRVLGKTPHH